MRHPFLAAVAVTLIAGTLPAEAANCQEGKHCFVHNKYTPTHCWTATGSAPATSVINSVTPTPAGPDGSPGPSKIMDGLTPFTIDPQVMASYKYVLVFGSSSFTFYDRATGQPLAASGCVPVSGTFRDLFAPLILDKDSTGAANADSINLQAPQTPITCDIHDIDKCPGSCVNEIYDARARFVRDGSGSGRWWIEVQGRNKMYTTDVFSGCTANGIQPDAARRYLMVAVSKTENPNDGFHEYVVVRDYADFPLFSVNNGRLLLAHFKDSKKLYVFDSDKLAAGTDIDPFLGQYDDATFADSSRTTPITQYSGDDGASYVLGENGNDLHVYAFIDPTKSPAHEKVTLDNHPDWYMPPVLRHGKVYLAFANEADSTTHRRAIDVFRVPVDVTSTSPIKIDVKKGLTHRLTRTDSTLERPGIEVETNDAVLVWYERIGLTGDNPAPQTRYNVHYPSDGGLDFRDATTLHTGSGAATSSDLQDYADIDLPGGNSDPDAVAFWVSHVYSDATGKKTQVVAQIKPGCGTETLCGTECADVKTDHDNCGSCDHECGKNSECDNGTCKSTNCNGANFMTDPKNCGGCGRVCPTGSCIQGRCCEPCVCLGGHTTGVCEFTAACEHICRAYEP